MYSETIKNDKIYGFFTDKEGSSQSPYMNLEVRKALGLEGLPWVRIKQVHEDKIACISEVGEDVVLDGYDGLVTGKKGIVLVTVHADCIPVQLYDYEKGVVCAVHAGWKGTDREIAYKAAKIMKEKYGCEDIKAYIGPGISLCCFEVGDDVALKFMKYEGACRKYGEKYHVDLKMVNKMQLEEAGVKSVTVSDICTYCDDDYISYRRDKGTSLRMASGIVLLP